MSVAWNFSPYKSGVTLQNQTHSLRTLYRRAVNKTTWSKQRNTTELFYFRSEFSRHPTSGRVFIMNERVNESISRSVFNATRTGNEFNTIMSTGNGFNKVIMYILPSRQEREILFEATRTCFWLELDVCSMCVRFATQKRDTSALINHQVKYFAKANSAFTIFLQGRHYGFIVYQFNTVSLFSNRDSKVTKRIPSVVALVFLRHVSFFHDPTR